MEEEVINNAGYLEYISLLLTQNIFLTITQNSTKMIENLKVKILLDELQFVEARVFCKTANKILPLRFSIVFIDFWGVVSNKL